MEQPKAAVAIATVFLNKTGMVWGSLAPRDQGLPGKYWLQQQATPDLSAKWQYYVDDGVNGKRTGWYPYDGAASDEVEELYTQHVANAGERRTAIRLVASGMFKYKVDLDKMTQQNTRTNKIRTIRRTAAAEVGEALAHKLRDPSKARDPKKPPHTKSHEG